MFKRTIAASFIFCWSAISVSAQEIVIEKANAISSGEKTTLAINYSGSGRIQFFAVFDDDSLTVDFPGVMSNFDFSGLRFDQVSKIEQTALDPDSDRGLSVKFTLNEAVEYKFFDGDFGSVILQFESKPIEKGKQVLAKKMVAQIPALKEPQESEADKHGLQKNVSLQGKMVHANIGKIDVLQVGKEVQVSVSVPGLESFKYFYLTGPDRYVIDFYGIYCQLDQDSVNVEDALINRVRIKQFQVHPKPITRMVLDLVEPIQINLREETTGNVVLSTDGFFPNSSLADNSRQTVATGAENKPTLPVKLETNISTGETNKEGVTIASKTVSGPHVNQEITESGDAKVQTTIQSSESVDPDSLVVSALPAVEEQPETTVPAQESPLFLTEVKEDPEVIPDVKIEVATAEIEAKHKGQSQTENQTANLEASSLTQPNQTHQLPFVMTDEVDRELESFIQSEKTFYSTMKNAPALKPKNDRIVVTNTAIENSIKLSESNALQSDDAVTEEFEKSSLFQDSDETNRSDMISGGEQTYRGFEIQGIDVVDVNVTDLLRFFADQVGFNLYVDPSVKNLKATYKFSNIPWDQAMDIILRNAGLDYQYDNGVLRVATTTKFKDEAAARRALQIEQELSVPPETVTFRLSYAKASEIAPIVTEYLSPRGSLLQDERTNTLIIEDIPKKMVAIRSLIKKLDTQIPQVTIESRIVETTKRFMRELGIQWGISGQYAPEYGTQTGLTFPNRVTVGGPRIGSTVNGVEGGYAVSFPVIDENPSGFGLSLGNILDTFRLDISLQMLESDGLGQIISAPKVTTQNNKTAIIQNGQKIPVQTIQRGTITVRYINAVLELEVTPHITSEKTIIMDLIVDKSEPDFTREVLGNPIINVRRAETRVLVKDGGTAVIGGIYVLNEQNSSRGIPGLRKVPFIRRIFGSERKEIANQELLIFVTPRIVKY